jgi:hypothetical protein
MTVELQGLTGDPCGICEAARIKASPTQIALISGMKF